MLNYDEVETALNKIAESGEVEIDNIDRLVSYIGMLYHVKTEEQLLEELEALLAEEQEVYVGEYESEASFAEIMSHGLGIITSDDIVTWLEIDWQGTYDKTFQWDYNNDGKYYWRNV